MQKNNERSSINGNNAWINAVLAVFFYNPILQTCLSEMEVARLSKQRWGDNLYRKYYKLIKNQEGVPEQYGDYGDAGAVLRFFKDKMLNDESAMDFVFHRSVNSAENFEDWVSEKTNPLALIKGTSRMLSQSSDETHNISHWVSFIRRETKYVLFDALQGGLQESSSYTLREIFQYPENTPNIESQGEHPYFLIYVPKKKSTDGGDVKPGVEESKISPG